MSEITIDDITKEMFDAFVVVQHSGITNMADAEAVVKYASELADTEITEDEVRLIINNYTTLQATFAKPKKKK